MLIRLLWVGGDWSGVRTLITGDDDDNGPVVAMLCSLYLYYRLLFSAVRFYPSLAGVLGSGQPDSHSWDLFGYSEIDCGTQLIPVARVVVCLSAVPSGDRVVVWHSFPLTHSPCPIKDDGCPTTSPRRIVFASCFWDPPCTTTWEGGEEKGWSFKCPICLFTKIPGNFLFCVLDEIKDGFKPKII